MKKKQIGPPVQGRDKIRWHPETFWCALKGHAAPAADVRIVKDSDALIALKVSDSAHMARCLRCDTWLLTDEQSASSESLKALTDIDVPQRGKALRDAIILKVIAVDRGFHAIVFSLVFVGLFLLETHLGGLQTTARHLVNNAQNTLDSTGQQSSRSFTLKELDHFINLKRGSVYVLMITAAVYAVIEGVEAVGLWKEKRWAEYLTALATVGFLPLEIHELMKRVTVVRIGALAINIAVLVYLLYAKRLFGIRGGLKEDEALIASADKIRPLPGQPIPQASQ